MRTRGIVLVACLLLFLAPSTHAVRGLRKHASRTEDSGSIEGSADGSMTDAKQSKVDSGSLEGLEGESSAGSRTETHEGSETNSESGQSQSQGHKQKTDQKQKAQAEQQQQQQQQQQQLMEQQQMAQMAQMQAQQAMQEQMMRMQQMREMRRHLMEASQQVCMPCSMGLQKRVPCLVSLIALFICIFRVPLSEQINLLPMVMDKFKMGESEGGIDYNRQARDFSQQWNQNLG